MVLLFTALFISCIAIFNRIIDPYNIFNTPKIGKINIDKPFFSTFESLHKKKPNAIILGSSRAMLGLDPMHYKWDPLTTYNLATAGSNIYESYMYMQYAHKIMPLKKVVLTLDFMSFNASIDKTSIESSEKLDMDYFSKLHLPNKTLTDKIDIFTRTLKDAISFGVFLDSFNTVLSQTELTYPLIQDKWIGSYIEHQPPSHLMFIRTENAFYRKHYHNFKFINNNRDNIQILEDIISFSHRNKIDLKIIISPIHARLLEIINSKGLWSKFEEWKKEIVIANNNKSKEYSKRKFPVWDFADYSTYTTEIIPLPNDPIPSTKWYWESSHYKKELGDLMLNIVLDSKYVNTVISSPLGHEISSKNIDIHLKEIKLRKKQWRKLRSLDIHDK